MSSLTRSNRKIRGFLNVSYEKVKEEFGDIQNLGGSEKGWQVKLGGVGITISTNEPYYQGSNYSWDIFSKRDVACTLLRFRFGEESINPCLVVSDDAIAI